MKKFNEMSVKAVLFASIVIGSIGNAAQSTLDLISDESKAVHRINGHDFLIFEHIDNERIFANTSRGATFNWDQARYYVLPPMVLVRRQSGRYVDHVRAPSGRQSINMAFQPMSYDPDSMVAPIRVAFNNAFASQAKIFQFPFESLIIDVAFVPETVEISVTGTLTSTSRLKVRIETSSEDAEFAAGQINEGAALPRVRATYPLSTSQRNQYVVNWSAIERDDLYRNYRGPSGPDFVTALQAARLASDLSYEITEFIWEEAEESSRVEALDWIVTGLKGSAGRSLPLTNEAWRTLKPTNLENLQGLTDKVTRIAMDARSMNDYQWCEEYAAYWERDEELISERDGNVGLEVIGIFDFGGGGGSDKQKRFREVSDVSESDCGRKKISDSFAYEEEGERYIPKSIYVYENIAKQGSVNTRLGSDRFRISQSRPRVDVEVVRE